MTDDLIKRLRSFAQGCRGSMWQSRDETIALMDAAADRIAELAARVTELEARAEKAEAALVQAVAEERERCAKVAEQFTTSAHIAADMSAGIFPKQSALNAAIAAAIREGKDA